MNTVKKVTEHTRSTFVRPAVKEIAVTTKIIDAIMPFFPKTNIVISGYLDDSDQYWKVNYHWEYLVKKLDDFRALDLDAPAMKSYALSLKDYLMVNPPRPQRGYVQSAVVGQPVDESAAHLVIDRHSVIAVCKKEFELMIAKGGVVDPTRKSNPSAKDKPWWLACAPVRKPGTSTHGSGCALDISGNNFETKNISLALGATMAFNEASHVHCEWKNGVTTPRV